jgi:aminopeptidase
MDVDTQLDRLAQVAVEVGVGLLPAQKLLLGAPLEAAPLARKIVEQAYRAGSRLVTVLWDDPSTTLARFRHAPRDSFAEVPGWLFDGTVRALREDHAYLHISAEDPALLAGQDPQLVATAAKARAAARRDWTEIISRMGINWCVIPAASAAWARMVFPGMRDDEAIGRLWTTIFAVCRVDRDDPVAAWRDHDAALTARRCALNDRRFSALHFRGPGTDLRVGLVEGHVWMGGSGRAGNGAICVPNVPTEEVFTMPHADRVEGTVTATKPLSLHGQLVEGIRVRFEAGRIVEASATGGQAVFDRLLDTDDGARRLGEVALVTKESTIARSGLLFFNSFFDENAASHIALGQAYAETLDGYDDLGPEGRRQHGANQSLIHVDWMIGSNQVDVDGMTAGGEAVPVMRSGAWVL